MKKLNYGLYVFFALSLFIVGCASSDKVGENNKGGKVKASDVSVDNPSISLADYLKRVPGVQVNGSGSSARVIVRGATSVYGNTSPLFVVDEVRYGRDFSRIQNAVPVNMIDKIRVLKGVEASSVYGMEGGAGVIEIETKKRE